MPGIIAHPMQTTTWTTFKQEAAPAVALDGYVAGPTRSNATHATFDHHADVDRLATRATCEQVSLALQFGPLPVLADPSRLDVHVNHADEDVCLAVWLLRNPERVQEAAVARLVAVEGMLDSTGGCVLPVDDTSMVEELAWVAAPCRARARTADAILATIDEVGSRIDRHLDGTAGREPVATDHRVIERSGPIAAIEEIGPYARTTLAIEGIEVFVAVRERDDGRHDLSIGKTSPHASYDLGRAFEQLNELEPGPIDDAWGGGATVGGSPLGRGTELPLAVVLDVLSRSHVDSTGPFLVQTRPIPELY